MDLDPYRLKLIEIVDHMDIYVTYDVFFKVMLPQYNMTFQLLYINDATRLKVKINDQTQ